MAKNHDEAKDIRLVSRIARIDYSNKTIQSPKSAIIGIKTWGRIDFLTHYCGWTFIYNNDVKVARSFSTEDGDSTKSRKRDAKKAAKDNTLTNKKKNNGKNV